MTIRKHEIKNCPRCRAEFECKSDSILLCQCQTVVLSPEQMDFVGDRFDECLCAACLQVLCISNEQQYMLGFQGKVKK
ncbi:MAG: cysteine-rich CWC family protein [Gammaproteobacteria bacterium]|nr:cysteine-rich CWC family protein [Gammaproteobacteria bacterium]